MHAKEDGRSTAGTVCLTCRVRATADVHVQVAAVHLHRACSQNAVKAQQGTSAYLFALLIITAHPLIVRGGKTAAQIRCTSRPLPRPCLPPLHLFRPAVGSHQSLPSPAAARHVKRLIYLQHHESFVGMRIMTAYSVPLGRERRRHSTPSR